VGRKTNAENRDYFLPFLVTAFLAGADFFAGFSGFCETALVAAGFADGADLAFAFAGAAFTETALVALTETGLAFGALVAVAFAGAGDLVETFTAAALAVVDLVAVAFAEVFASDLALVDFFFSPAPPKAAAQPSV